MIQDQKDGHGKHHKKRKELPTRETNPNMDAQSAPDEPKGNEDGDPDEETLTTAFHVPNILVSAKRKTPITATKQPTRISAALKRNSAASRSSASTAAMATTTIEVISPRVSPIMISSAIHNPSHQQIIDLRPCFTRYGRHRLRSRSGCPNATAWTPVVWRIYDMNLRDFVKLKV
jgi:hypothetical protein